MALDALWLQEVDYPARIDRVVFDSIWSEGILGSSSFEVAEEAVPAMSVQVAAGVGVVQGDDQSFQGKYLLREQALTTGVVIGAAPGSGTRHDLIVIKVRDSNAGGAVGDDAIFEVVAGTPDVSPVDPSIPDSALVLARVRVPAGTGSITNALIDDLRVEATAVYSIIDTANIVDAAVTEPKLATGAVSTTKVQANNITDALLRQSTGLSVIGRSASTTGDVADITAGSDGYVLRRSGSAIGFGTVAAAGLASSSVETAKLADNAVSDAKLRDSAGLSVIGNTTNSTANPGDIVAGSDGYVLRRSGTALGFGQVTSAGLAAGAVTDGVLRDSAGLSVVGRSASTSGDVADIVAGTDGEVLLRNGTVVEFGQVTAAGLAPGSVTASQIAAGAVGNTEIRDGSALSVIGRSANSTGDVADIAAGTDGHVLRRSGTTLGFGTIGNSAIADDAITFGKLQNVSTYGVVGLTTVTTANVGLISPTADNQVLRRSGTSIGWGTIATGGIADGAVTNAKINDVAGSKVTGTVSVANGGTGSTTAASALTALNGYGKGSGATSGYRITISSSPATGGSNGDIWFQT